MDDSCILILIQKSVCFSSYFQFISNHVFNSLDKKKKKCSSSSEYQKAVYITQVTVVIESFTQFYLKEWVTAKHRMEKGNGLVQKPRTLSNTICAKVIQRSSCGRQGLSR